MGGGGVFYISLPAGIAQKGFVETWKGEGG
jgi:hypothetical protein